MKNSKRSNDLSRAILTGLCVFLAVILVVSLIATLVMEYFLQKLDNMENLNTETLSSEQIDDLLKETDPVDPDFSGPVLDHNDVDFGNKPTTEIGGENIIQILLIGQDRRAGQGRQRSDAMILVTVNKEKKTLTFTSFMRDMYVQIPGYRGNKINAAYQFEGMPLLNQVLYESFGIQVDGNVEVDFDGFMEIVDILGGVDIELTEAEANYLNSRGNWEVEENSHWNLKAGVNHLNGSQALAYSRIRYVSAAPDGVSDHNYADYGRTSRQRRVLNAMLERIKGMGMGDVNKVLPLVDKIVEHVATDMDKNEILQYIREILPILTQLKINNLRIPADGTYYSAYVGSLDALVPDLEANRKILEENLK